MNIINLLLRYSFVSLPEGKDIPATVAELSTVMMNLSYFGYALNTAATKRLLSLSSSELSAWWQNVSAELKKITGDDRSMADFVVYKNFPEECLEMNQAQYWFNQICIYWGVPQDLFAEDVEPREKMDEAPKLKILRQSSDDTTHNILDNLIRHPARWVDDQKNDVLFLTNPATNSIFACAAIDWSSFGFKENLVTLAAFFIKNGIEINVNTATDVLRLAVGLSDGDVSLREKSKLRRFSRKERRFLLKALENCSNLEEDVGAREERFKRLVHSLHPGDYKDRFPRVTEVAHRLYHGNIETFNSRLEKALSSRNSEALKLLSQRPGEFRRRLLHALHLYGDAAAAAFVRVSNKLTTIQLVGLRRFLKTLQGRETRIFPPKGNWSKIQITPAKTSPDPKILSQVIEGIDAQLRARVPKIQYLDPMVEMVKLPTNDTELGPYTRGTEFPIPKDVSFIRTASFWRFNRTVWFDNGINFFDSNWKEKGTLCWDSSIYGQAAVFSGDPVSGYTKGATQMIDLYPEKLKKLGIRYCVWGILCFSRLAFDQVNEVYAALQWGTDSPQKGELFEPSRAQLNFPLTGKGLTKYVCYIDLESMKMVYMDANLPSQVHSANSNESLLEASMPAFVEYLNGLPSIGDLFRNSVDSNNGVGHVLYSDENHSLKLDEDGNKPIAYVFKPENKENDFEDLNINQLLK